VHHMHVLSFREFECLPVIIPRQSIDSRRNKM
jgi:hypothetical protein